MENRVPHEDLAATLALRKEQGPEYEAEMVDILAEKVEAVVQRRLAQEIELSRRTKKQNDGRIALAIVSMALGIPLTAIGMEAAGFPGLIVTWVGIVLVNLVFGWQKGNKPFER